MPPENTLVGAWWLKHINPQPGSIWGERTLFAGWMALALAIVGFVVLLRGDGIPRRAWVFPALVVVGFLLSLGPSPAALGGLGIAPFAWISSVPGFEGIRAPARFAIVMMLGVSGLAAIGCSAIVGKWTSRRPAMALAIVPVMLAEMVCGWVPSRQAGVA